MYIFVVDTSHSVSAEPVSTLNILEKYFAIKDISLFNFLNVATIEPKAKLAGDTMAKNPNFGSPFTLPVKIVR